jgi:hypothetical protein
MQYQIFNFSLPRTDKHFVTGYTVNSDGTLNSAQTTQNQAIEGDRSSFFNLLKSMRYPEDLIKEVSDTFEAEKSIKTTTDMFFKNNKETMPNFIKTILVSPTSIINKAVAAGEPLERAEAIADQVSAILANSTLFNETIGNWAREEIVKPKSGQPYNVISPQSVNNLKKIFNGFENTPGLKSSVSNMIHTATALIGKLTTLVKSLKQDPSAKKRIDAQLKTSNSIGLFEDNIIPKTEVAMDMLKKWLTELPN